MHFENQLETIEYQQLKMKFYSFFLQYIPTWFVHRLFPLFWLLNSDSGALVLNIFYYVPPLNMFKILLLPFEIKFLLLKKETGIN